MVNLPLPLFAPFWVALGWSQLPDSLENLTATATQIQTVVGSAMSHPIWAITTLLLAIVLIQMVADLIKRILKASLTFVLKLPFMLSQWLWQRVTASTVPFPWKAAPSTVLPQSAQIHQLIDRLEALREEQDQIVATLKDLLSSTEDRSASNQLTSEAAENTAVSALR